MIASNAAAADCANPASITAKSFLLTVRLPNLTAADIILGCSQVEVSAIPQPAIVALVGLGLMPMTYFV